MTVSIVLTAEQEQVVLAAHGYTTQETPPDPDVPELDREPPDLEPPDPDVEPLDFKEFYGIEFGTASNGKNKDLPSMTTGDGLVTWRFFVGDDLALEAGVSDHGGDFHIHQVQDELAKWPAGKGYEDIIESIEAMGLDDTDYAVFPGENIKHTELQGVAYGGEDWLLEMWQQDTLRFALTGPGQTPPELFKFTLAQSGSKLLLQYYWK